MHPEASIDPPQALIGAIGDRPRQQVRDSDRASILLRLESMGLAPR